MFFFFQPNYKINLEFAAKVIHGPVLPEAVMKTRIRRLYDIANILQVNLEIRSFRESNNNFILYFQSLQLIRKVQVTDQLQGCKKPAFEYIGPKVEIIGETFTNQIISIWQTSSLELEANINILDFSLFLNINLFIRAISKFFS